MTRSKTLERINVSRLPSPPNVAVQILKLASDANASLHDMAEVLEMDPAISAQVLRICNSAAYCRGRDITSLPQAVSALGSRSVSIIALGFSLKSAIPGWRHESGLTDTDLWRQSVATAVTARSLARLARAPEVDGSFLCGLMSRIGQLLLYSTMPEEYGEVIEASNGRIPTREQEKELLGLTHQEAGALLLERWGLPNLFKQVVRTWGTDTTYDSEEIENVAAIVTVGDAASQMLFNEEKADLLTVVYDISQRKLGLSGGEVDRLFRSCGEELVDTLNVFDIPVDVAFDCDGILEEARQQLVNVSLGLVADLTVAHDNTTSLRQENEELAKASVSDGLTGLFNRAGLDQELMSLETARQAACQAPPYSIIMVDLDRFKSINDTHGHAAGDDVLRSLGDTLQQSARTTDFVARYGGEEFVVVLTNAGNDEAESVAERLRESIEQRPIELKDGTLSVTASVGVASSDSFPENVSHDEILEAADQALYQAKRTGRNKVVAYQGSQTMHP